MRQKLKDWVTSSAIIWVAAIVCVISFIIDLVMPDASHSWFQRSGAFLIAAGLIHELARESTFSRYLEGKLLEIRGEAQKANNIARSAALVALDDPNQSEKLAEANEQLRAAFSRVPEATEVWREQFTTIGAGVLGAILIGTLITAYGDLLVS